MNTQDENHKGQSAKTVASGRGNLPVLRQLSRLGSGPNRGAPRGVSQREEKLRVETIEYNGLRWVNLERPDDAEVGWLYQNFEINPLHLEDVTSRLQRPKIDDYEDYLFIVLHFPVYNKAERTSVPSEIDIFVGSDYIITTHDGKLRALNRLFEQCKNNSGKRHGVLGRTPTFAVYRIIDVLVDYCFPIIDKLAEKLEDLDDKIFRSASRNTIVEISVRRRDIIALRRIIKPQIPVIANLEHRLPKAEQEELEGYFSDVKDHISKIWDSLEEFKEIVEGLSATYDSLASHRLNEVIKTLTIISVVMLPMTLISSIYGMNVPLPWQDRDWAFYVVMALIIFAPLLMLIYFRFRKWI
jgi:magnesium transporter